MSYTLAVYLKRSNMPSPSLWHSAIVEAGFPVALDTDFDVDSFSGFLPCPVNGETSGFEYYASPVLSEDAAEFELPPGTDFSVNFCIGTRPLELVSALAASSVLAAISRGTLDDPQAGESMAPETAVSWAKTQLAQFGAQQFIQADVAPRRGVTQALGRKEGIMAFDDLSEISSLFPSLRFFLWTVAGFVAAVLLYRFLLPWQYAAWIAIPIGIAVPIGGLAWHARRDSNRAASQSPN